MSAHCISVILACGVLITMLVMVVALTWSMLRLLSLGTFHLPEAALGCRQLRTWRSARGLCMAIRMREMSSSGRILAHSVRALALDHWSSKRLCGNMPGDRHPVSVKWLFD